MKIIIIRSNNLRHKLQDLEKLHKELCEQIPTGILIVPYDFDYEVAEIDAKPVTDISGLIARRTPKRDGAENADR